MRYFLVLFLAIFCLLSVSCKKEPETTGMLEVSFSMTVPGEDRIYIFAAENENYPVLSIPQGNQTIRLNVGNYLMSWNSNASWDNGGTTGFQIRPGETTRAHYDGGWLFGR